MVNGDRERKDILEHHLAGRFRSLISEFGGNEAVADELLSRFRSLEENKDGMLIGNIYRRAEGDYSIPDSWVELQFNPHRKSLLTSIFLATTAKRELATDLLNDVIRVRIQEQEEAVVFLNREGRLVWLDKDNKISTFSS